MAERSLLAAVSGIQANQTYLDEIGNNIANADTVGYKEGTVQFGDLLNEQISGATAPASGSGGVNPVAVGSGVRVSAVATQLSEGSLMVTGQATDVAITGSGYLVVKSGGQQLYTRDGALTVDASNHLTTLSGGQVQGWNAVNGKVTTNSPIGAIIIPKGETIAANATTELTLSGNLPAQTTKATSLPSITYNAYDSLGNVIPVTITFTALGTDKWSVTATVKASTATGKTVYLFGSGATPNTKPAAATLPELIFKGADGQLTVTAMEAEKTGKYFKAAGTSTGLSVTATAMTAMGRPFPAGTDWKLMFPEVGSSGAVTQYSGQETVTVTSTDGYPSGALVTYSIGGDGVITGSFSNGKTQALGQIALAGFANPSGLQDMGNGLLVTSPNSGQPTIGAPGTGTLGTLLGGQLEQSNVTMGSQLTNLITAQEAYQANTKVIQTTQQVIQSLESV